ncbi:hypothetical protein LCGT_0105 [Lactococcus garvieae ATCC 49156]|uniref:Uncharacterized protein n=1 Tax=Lactococcus garvieae (strain Lg2) TaxID=420890 RepID=F9VGT2_LACGL|nr:hypothetical protein LCGT_0105 [Lactococcus garvieae ATCC 49156]BAK59565.1 hypothetical protein LCGL_0105 [Lactococcus garvieae Lg2]
MKHKKVHTIYIVLFVFRAIKQTSQEYFLTGLFYFLTEASYLTPLTQKK